MSDGKITLTLAGIWTLIFLLAYYMWYNWPALWVHYEPVDPTIECVAAGHSQIVCDIRATALQPTYTRRVGPKK